VSAMDTTVARAPRAPVVERSRPLGAAIAAALLCVVALAGLVFGPHLIVLGVVIANDVPGDERALVLTSQAMLEIGCLVVSVVSAYTARGLLRTARWACPTALCVAVTLIV